MAAFWTRIAAHEKVDAMLGPQVWLSGPGRLLAVDRQVVIERLRRPPVEPLQLEQVRSYDLPTLRRMLPGGVATAMATRVGIGDGRAVCADLCCPHAELSARYTVLVGWRDRRWTVRSLPLAPIDLEWLAGTPVSVDEEPAVRAAHSLVRVLVMGQRDAFVAARHHLADRIETKTGPVDADSLMSARTGPRFDRLGWVIGPTRALRTNERSAEAASMQDKLRKKRSGAGRDFVPTWTRTQVLRVVGDRLEAQPEWEVMLLLQDDRHGFSKRVPTVVAVLSGDPHDGPLL